MCIICSVLLTVTKVTYIVQLCHLLVVVGAGNFALIFFTHHKKCIH